MPLIDEELTKTHVKEERKLRFGEYVREQKAAGKKGMKLACLHSHGHRDYYAKGNFAPGMHRSMWILKEGDNPKLLLFEKKKDAQDYAKELQGLLRGNGYPHSTAWAEQIALRKETPHPYSGLIMPETDYESSPRFLIFMKVR